MIQCKNLAHWRFETFFFMQTPMLTKIFPIFFRWVATDSNPNQVFFQKKTLKLRHCLEIHVSSNQNLGFLLYIEGMLPPNYIYIIKEL